LTDFNPVLPVQSLELPAYADKTETYTFTKMAGQKAAIIMTGVEFLSKIELLDPNGLRSRRRVIGRYRQMQRPPGQSAISTPPKIEPIRSER